MRRRRHRWVGLPVVCGVAVLVLLGALDVSTASGQIRQRPVLIGALTESWGPTPTIVGIRDGLVELGYRENEDFVIGVRFTQGDQLALPAAARQLVERGAQILVTGGGGVNEAAAVQLASGGTVPVVFMGGSDPVGAGLVQSLARPGGNITGVADLDFDLVPKRLELFRELVPSLKRVLLPYDVSDAHLASQLDTYRAAASRLGITLIERPLRTQSQAGEVLLGVQKERVDGILSPRPLSLNIPGFIIEAGKRHRVPTMLHASFHVEQGGLASYAANLYEMGRHGARLVDKVIKGVKPADIPVEQVKVFEFAINLQTARALELTIPSVVQLRADRVIQ